MARRVRRYLRSHGWVVCVRCGRCRRRQWADEHGWLFNICTRHPNAQYALAYLAERDHAGGANG